MGKAVMAFVIEDDTPQQRFVIEDDAPQPSDVRGASGVSERDLLSMPGLTSPTEGAAPADPGQSPESYDSDIMKYFKKQLFQTGEDLSSAAHAVGVGARKTLEGVGALIDLPATPLPGNAPVGMVGILQNMGHDPRGGGKYLADVVGLPEPKDAGERIIGEGMSMLTTGGGTIKLATEIGKVAQAGSTTQKVAQAMAARPDLQAASAVGAGVAGQTMKEAGGGPVAQFTAALVGGLAAPAGLSGVQKLAAIQAAAKDPNLPQRTQAVISEALKDAGVSADKISPGLVTQLSDDVLSALKRGEVDPATIRRLVEYRTSGLIPTAGPLTLDPAVITQQKFWAKMGINSTNPKLHALGQIEHQNNQRLIGLVNDLGANNPQTSRDLGEKIITTLNKIDDVRNQQITHLYDQAKTTAGRSAKLDPSKFTQTAGDYLDFNDLNGSLPADIRVKLNRFATGEIPLTVSTAEQFKRNLSMLQRGTNEGSIKKALGYVRQALDETPLLPGQEMGKESIDAFNKARNFTRAWKQTVENTPALQAVIDGTEPENFVQRFIIGTGDKASLNSLKKMMSVIDSPLDKNALVNPEMNKVLVQSSAVKGRMRDSIAQYLKESAIGAKPDEAGLFSSSGYNKALANIGVEKLHLFFNRDEVRLLQKIGKLASYEQFQPRGAAVNNSNTAPAILSHVLDRVAGSSVIKSLPLGEAIVTQPAANMVAGARGREFTRVPNVAPPPGEPMLPIGAVAGPAAAMSNTQQ